MTAKSLLPPAVVPGAVGALLGGLRNVEKIVIQRDSTWRLPKIGVPPNHPFSWYFPLETNFLGV